MKGLRVCNAGKLNDGYKQIGKRNIIVHDYATKAYAKSLQNMCTK